MQGNCQLAELPAAGLVWEMNDKEFLTRASGKNIRIEYRYDNEGYPIGKTSTKAETVFAVNLQPSTDPLKNSITPPNKPSMAKPSEAQNNTVIMTNLLIRSVVNW